ncbi:MAG: hypothetical protein WDA09_05000 [Bacteriovoracaceae bacterium]
MTEHVSPPQGFKPRNFTQVISLIVGAVLFVLGACGLLYPGFAGLHLGVVHCLIICVAGATLFYNGGWKDNGFYAFMCCFFFGAFFGLLGLIGFIFGSPGTPSIGFTEPDPNLFVLIKGIAEYGRLDHILNAFIGIILMGGAFDWQRRGGLTSYRTHRKQQIIKESEEKRKQRLRYAHR